MSTFLPFLTRWIYFIDWVRRWCFVNFLLSGPLPPPHVCFFVYTGSNIVDQLIPSFDLISFFLLTLSVDYKANWLCLHNVMNQLEKIMVFLNRSDTENSHNAWLVEWIFMLYHCIHYYYYIILSCSTSLNILRDIVVQAPRGFTLVRHILPFCSQYLV